MTQVLIDRATLEQLVVALEDSIDCARHEYETYWGHGLPTRKAQIDRMKESLDQHEASITAGRAALANAEPTAKPETKLWLWKNFIDGRQEYWAFDNLYPININDDDPQTLGDPCGYALFKPSRNGRKDTQ